LYGNTLWDRCRADYKLGKESEVMLCLEQRMLQKRKRTPEADGSSEQKALEVQVLLQEEVMITTPEAK
jgi:hypothetical protein